MAYPRMMLVRQHFVAPVVKDPARAVREELARLSLSDRIRPGDSVAVTAGSRGIAHIALIVRTVVEELKARGARPFVVPAMGSHGGATAEGQRAVIEGFGITEDYIGAPIKAGMEVVQVGSLENGVPVYFDRYAHEADHVVVVGRIKPHTDFSADIESGLNKMMLIGLGKHKGAIVYHKAFAHYSFDQIVSAVGRTVIEKCKILFGLGIIENQENKTALIRALAPQEFLEQEKQLLLLARKWMPRLPFPRVDLLIVDQIGKEISGTGMDTNVVGRKDYMYPAKEEIFPKVRRIYVRDLTEESHGNATGVGIADYAHTQLVRKIDYNYTYVNCATAHNTRGAATPLHYDTDRKVLDIALNNIGYVEPERARVIRIRNTLDVEQLMISEAYEPEMEGRDDLEIIEPAREMAFHEDGNLLAF